MFGPDQPVSLNLVEIPQAEKALEGVIMELNDCAFPLLKDIKPALNPEEGFAGANWCLLVGSVPRRADMERGDLLGINGKIFTGQGQAIQNHAASDVRTLVVGNPCNTNCLIAMHNAPDVPRDRFHAMTRLDQNRAVNQLAKKAGTDVNSVKNVTIWGNHSAKQVPDYHNATINGAPATEVIDDTAWLQGDFVSIVAKRGAAIIDARGKSSASSAANAAVEAVRALINPTPAGETFSSAVVSDGNPYGMPDGLIFSFPCRSAGDGSYEIIGGQTHDDFLKGKIEATAAELVEEREVIQDLLR